VFKNCLAAAAVLLLVGCGVPKPRQEPPHPAPAAGAGVAPPESTHADGIPPQPAGQGVFVIDPAQSEVRLLVYRAGAMARLGHDHVITHRAVTGWIRFTGDPTAAQFAISLPVAAFVVDNAAARAEEGDEFLEEVGDEAKEGTRHNMLSAALLDAEHHPNITLVSVSVDPGAGVMNATLTLRIAGHESTLVVPFAVATSKAQISASGSVELRQTALGLKPFSVMMGALQVKDEFTVKFTLVAMVT
jgi:polyisoprenoid-binding protein YceI